MITITDIARSTIKDANKILQIRIVSGGCAGYQYEMNFIEDEDAVDIVIDGIVDVDQTTLNLMDGSIIDYEKSLMNSGFVINNPNAESKCGCGVSFTV